MEPFHPPTAELGPSVLALQAAFGNTQEVLPAVFVDTGSSAQTDGPRPVVIALAVVLVLMAGILFLVFLQC